MGAVKSGSLPFLRGFISDLEEIELNSEGTIEISFQSNLIFIKIN
jgi:hypothetical protein